MISEGVIDGVTLSLGFGLDVIDVVVGIFLVVGSFAGKALNLASLLLPKRTISDSAERKARVAIIGASFAGCEVSNLLKRDKRMHVTLINEKEYFEYTPGVLRCFVDPGHYKKISFQLPRMNPQLIVGYASSINNSSVQVQSARSGVSEESVPFDACVLALGSGYSGVIKPGKQEATLHDRARAWQEANIEVRAASTIVVLGAGLVGVELVAELVCAHPDKTIYLIDRSKEACKELPQRAREYIERWMHQRGVQLLLSTSYASIDKKGAGWACTLADGSVLEADLVYRCTGAPPRSEPLRGTPLAAALDARGGVVVDDTLQVRGEERVFAAGDVMEHARTEDMKCGFSAEQNGQLVAENIRRMVEGREMVTYPEWIVGPGKKIPVICVVSLGKHDGVLVLSQYAIGGAIAAVAKWAVEWTLVGKARCRPLPTALMGMGEAVVKLFFSPPSQK